MSSYSKLIQTIGSSKHIVVIQADNPDGDSLATSLALEEILSNQGINVTLYCGVAMPSYLRYMDGWDRVVDQLPTKFDASIIVDTAALSLLETLQKQSAIGALSTRPCIVIDHHTAESTINFASVSCIEPAVSTGEIIYRIAKEANWELSKAACEYLTYSIMSDSLGLTSEAVTPDVVRIVAELMDNGVVLANLDDKRRQLQKKSQRIFKYKGTLIDRVQFAADGRIATVHIPWSEIEQYSHEYNPSVLVIDEMRMIESVQVAIAFKTYPDGKITAKIRANYGYQVADKLAEKFGGGGHPYAAGFKIMQSKDFDEVHKQCITKATVLLDEVEREQV